MRKAWAAEWRSFAGESRSPAELLEGLWLRLPGLPTSLGRLADESAQRGVPPEAPASTKVRGDDLLPIDPCSVATFLMDKPGKVANMVACMVVALNHLSHTQSQGGWEGPFTGRKLTSAQEEVVTHLCEAAVTLESSGFRCKKTEDVVRSYEGLRFDYMGEPIIPMEDLVASKVIGAWPKVGQAAVQDAEDFLTKDLKAKLRDPVSCLKPVEDWPDSPHESRVRASDTEWRLIVEAAHARGLMVPIEPDEVFRDHEGRPVLNGAGAVRKVKVVDGQQVEMQRFISNLIPSNMYQNRLEGDDRLLPYLGQLTLLEQGPTEIWLCDSEDFTSCFNLFRIPKEWRKYMAFNKLVDASAFGGPEGHMVYAAMNVLPMGWVSSVAVIQAIVRHLVFEEARVPLSSEVAKTKPMPKDDDLTVIYLDSFDELRKLEESCKQALEGKMSGRHQAFLDVCERRKLPLNEAKRLVASTQGTLQGGELDGEKGRYGLAREKMTDLLSLGSGLLSMEEWDEAAVRHFVGKATFGMCFRRPIFSVLESIFLEIQDRFENRDSARPRDDSLDEVALVMCLVPLMFTNLKAQVDDEISVTDASPSGGGAATASCFRDEPLRVIQDHQECFVCRRALQDDYFYPCPASCGAWFCSLSCALSHREHADGCPRFEMKVPKFGERFSGKRAPLSHAVALQGEIEVQPPFDLHFGDDIFTPEGKETLTQLMDDPALAGEHWAPECKLFSKARGKPITLRSGRQIRGPQPVRDHKHLMGFPWLSSEQKGRVRQSNTMVLKALKRGKDQRRKARGIYWSAEHPRRSWMWDFSLVREIEEDQRCQYAIGSHCCWGGDRFKEYAFLSDLPPLKDALTVACPGHVGLKGYQVEELPDGTLYFPTEEEAEYPWNMCVAYAEALKQQLKTEGRFEQAWTQLRESHYLAELQVSTSRLARDEVAVPMAAVLAIEESTMKRGREREHLRELLRHATYRGTDVRFMLEVAAEDEVEVHECPYLAMRWDWKTIMAYPWRQEGHINELEILAVAVFLKRRGRTKGKMHSRFFHVLDSMVTRGCLAKGRSSSRRLNRVAKRCSAYLLAQDSYMFPLWSISQWNFADRPSRLYETKK